MNTIGEQIAAAWQALIDLIGKLVVPDWGWLVGLLPLLLVPLVLLFLTVLVLGWLVYQVRRPRGHVAIVEGPRPLALDAAGQPRIPPGQPFSLREGLSYPPGTVRSDGGALLSVQCPGCGLERAADVPSCRNCGLVLRYESAVASARPSGPPSGGAAIA